MDEKNSTLIPAQELSIELPDNHDDTEEEANDGD